MQRDKEGKMLLIYLHSLLDVKFLDEILNSRLHYTIGLLILLLLTIKKMDNVKARVTVDCPFLL